MNIRLPLAAKCLDCGYLLRGLQEPRCPECGKPFLPGDPSTYQIEDRSRWRRFYARPPGWLHLTTVCAVALYALSEASAPGEMFGFPITAFLLLAAFLTLLLIGQDYIFRMVAQTYRHNPVYKESHHTVQRLRFRWAATPICALLIGSVIFYPWPAWMRFKLSQSAFEQAVKDYKAGTLPGGAQWLGLYRVERVTQESTGHLFFKTGESGFGDQDGFIYRTSSLPPQGELYLLEKLASGWFFAHMSW